MSHEQETLVGLRERLRAPLPKEAIKVHPTKSWMSSINGAFIVERLNDCFGEDGWSARYEIVEARPDTKMVVVKAILEAEVRETRLGAQSEGPQLFKQVRGKIYREAFGGNDNPDRGDAYKGACTDALGKIASQLGIAGEVYKGMLDEVQAPAPKEKGAKADRKKYEAVNGIVTELRDISPETVWLVVNSNGLWIRTTQVVFADKLRKSLGCKIDLTAFWDKTKGKKTGQDIQLLTVSAVHGVFEPRPQTEFVRKAESPLAPDDEDRTIPPDMK